MSDLSLPLRRKLAAVAEIGLLALVEKSISPQSGSTKYLFSLQDGRRIESVYIPEKDRRTLCISSQVGCALGCRFCATGTLGFTRNLSAGEIVDQVLFAERDQMLEITNVVFMGMGEPFMNTDAVLQAAARSTMPMDWPSAAAYRHIDCRHCSGHRTLYRRKTPLQTGGFAARCHRRKTGANRTDRPQIPPRTTDDRPARVLRKEWQTADH
jgi:hypothetical protein